MAVITDRTKARRILDLTGRVADSLQIAASPFAEATIYAAAAAFESATPLHLKRPAL